MLRTVIKGMYFDDLLLRCYINNIFVVNLIVILIRDYIYQFYKFGANVRAEQARPEVKE